MCRKAEPTARTVGAGGGTLAGGQLLPNDSTPAPNGQVQIYDQLTAFYPVDNRFIDDGYAAAIGCQATAVYNVLKRHARAGLGDVWPSYERIAERSGVSYRTVMQSIAAMEALGLIHVARETGRSNVITLTTADRWLLTGSYVDSHGREIVLDVAAVRAAWTPKRKRGRPRTEANGASSEEKPPRRARTFSENPRAVRVPTPAPGAYEQESGDQETSGSEQETSSCAPQADACATVGNDDDAIGLGTVEIAVNPESENTDGEDDDLHATVQEIRESGVSGPAPAGLAEAAEWALLEVAPSFDDARRFVSHFGGERVGLAACVLLADRGKRAQLRNPAGFVRRLVEAGEYVNGSAREMWHSVVDAIAAGEQPDTWTAPVPRGVPNDYAALAARYGTYGQDDDD